MEERFYTIGELAELSGVTVRTLQYYDKIELLPAQRKASNIRYYTELDLMNLQQILFYKRLGIPLKEIKTSIKNYKDTSDFNRILKKQEKILLRQQMETKTNLIIIEAIRSSIDMDSEIDMDSLGRFILGLEKQTLLEYTKIEYDQETEEKYGDQSQYSHEILEFYWQWKQIVLEAAALKLTQKDIESQLGYNLGKKWHEFLTIVEERELSLAFEKGLEKNDQWPKEDLDLFHFTQDFIDQAYKYYMKKKGI